MSSSESNVSTSAATCDRWASCRGNICAVGTATSVTRNVTACWDTVVFGAQPSVLPEARARMANAATAVSIGTRVAIIAGSDGSMARPCGVLRPLTSATASSVRPTPRP
eukprot:7087441-Prymnesium_polylepis.1